MMEQRLFILLFFTVVPLVLSVPRKYYLIQQGKTWSNAKAYCRATHKDLAIITSNEELVRLQNEAQRYRFSANAWIGLYNNYNNWIWSIGSEPLGSLRLWSLGEPNNYGGSEACGSITPTGWNDMPCGFALPSVCFDASKTGNNSYIYISTTMSWAGAQAYCRQHYTDLVSIKDPTENSVIAAMVSGYTWFGLYRDGWRWTDQTIFSTVSWLSGQPDNALWNAGCGFLSNSRAAVAQCSTIMPFFCFSFITEKQQIVKVKVQSNQDVNDPQIKVAILEKIKQKVKDHGMTENITVKWREESDGTVFHKEKEEL
ncbi:C-type mannose receptor 2-like isoform X2 [Hemibagrus wyckioides]|uniref:C-type mannose receptor 2-like isoform X2 n=1 Tax=Hemibagrus wyckioides TaxID=337641 RepID=UPI00266BF04F|nr:C-type mannose receptor 2-like isoform X2 [Hemibagrus wyckioides]XP_058235872.1 C-type mannose receptor 2-like isoform X2 [Hemibagrus wyckioides]